MPDPKPIVYLIRGNDSYTINKMVKSMIDQMGDPNLVDLNLTRLEGKTCGEDDLRSAVLSLPFLMDRRLVVLANPLAMFGARGGDEGEDAGEPALKPASAAARAARERFQKLLDEIPETTGLVLVVSDGLVWRRGKQEWDTLSEGHWLMRWLRTTRQATVIKDYLLPDPKKMPDWIRQEAKAMGGAFSPAAAGALAEFIGNDTQTAVQEIAKLLTYVDYRRPVDQDDVAQLSTRENQAPIFSMVDALGERDGKRAMRLLHEQLEEAQAGEVFAMIIRQFRLLVQTRELLDEGKDETYIMAEVRHKASSKVSMSQAKSLAAQARRFSLGELEAIYRRLLDLDLASKTSQMSYETAMDVLVTDLAR